MSYCIYLRKSRKDKELEKYGEIETLKRHEQTLLNLAKNNNLKICKIYREVVSGDTIKQRPEIQKLLKETMKKTYDGVLVMEIERLARGNTIDQGIIADAFKISNTKIITPSKIFDPSNEFDEEYFEFGLFMARREYKVINRRIQRGRIASLNEGKFIASTAPFGYKKLKIENSKGYTLKIDENKASIVKLIFELYTKKFLGLNSICKTLDEMSINPPIADNWCKSTIKDILTNPTYIGKIRWSYKKEEENSKSRYKNENYILVSGLHKPIISESIFEKAQNILNTKHIPPTKSNIQLKNHFSGLIYCKKCNTKLTRVNSNTKAGYYILKCPNNYCKNIPSPIYLIENSLTQALTQWFENKNVIFDIKKEDEYSNLKNYNKNINLIRRKIKNLNYQTENLYNLLEQKIYSIEVFKKRNEKLNIELNKLKNIEKKFIIYKSIEEKKLKESTPFEVKENNIMEIYKKLKEPSDKNKFLKEIIEKIEYERNMYTKKNKRDEAIFTLTVYPKLN